MSTTSVSPLAKPPFQKEPRLPSGKNINHQGNNADGGKGMGVSSRGGRGRVNKLFVALRCMSCGEVQNLIYGGQGKGNELFYPSLEELFSEERRSIRPPEWHRCVGCSELQPTIGYRLIDWGSEPLYSPQQMKALSQRRR